jgi:hypothetical protein
MLAITIKRKKEKITIITSSGEVIDVRLAEGNKDPFARLVFDAKKCIKIKRVPLDIEGELARCDKCLVEIPWRSAPEEKIQDIFCSKKCAKEYEKLKKEYSPLKGGPA